MGTISDGATGGADTTTAFDEAVRRVRGGDSIADAVNDLLDQLSPNEKLWLLDGDTDFWQGMAEMSQGYNTEAITMGRIDRLGIPGFRFSDGPRGVVMGESTAFPVSMARGATWDVTLEERVGLAIGREMRAQGANFFGGVCINLPRHPAWGRAQETYGDDPILLGEFGAALTRGVQRNAMAVAKHYALNSMENARFTVDVTADEAALHEVYLAHFRRVVDEGVAGIMASYNSVNGEWAGQNEELLENTLREKWNFEGVTLTDFVSGFRDAALSLRAGMDVEAPMRQQRARDYPGDLEAGNITWEHVDRAARRILKTQIAHYAAEREEEPQLSVVFSSEHRQLARDAAARAMVLLKNDSVAGVPVLPIDASRLSSLAVIGRLADVPNTGDHGSSAVRSPEVVTALAGLRDALPDTRIRAALDDDISAAVAAASDTDAAVVVVGYTYEDEGEYIGGSSAETFADPAILALFPPLPEGVEPDALMGAAGVMGDAVGGDRSSLRLRPIDEQIIRAVSAVNSRTIVVVVTAGAVIMENWKQEPAAIVLGWYSGSEGGYALVDVLTGRVDVGGRLPYSIPTDEAHLPYFDREATEIVYDKWFGQRLLDRDGHEAAFPLGYGLSYTSFEIRELHANTFDGDYGSVDVTVANVGKRAGRHVVQVYGAVDADDFPRRVLLGFQPVELNAGETVTLMVPISLRPLQRWVDGGFAWAAESATLEASAYSGDSSSARTTIQL